MKSNFRKILALSILSGYFFIPVALFAQAVIIDTQSLQSDPRNLQSTSQNPNYIQNQSEDGGTGANDPRATNFQIVPCEGVDNPATGKKEIECDFNMLIVGFNRVVKFLLYLSIPVVVGMVLYMGFKYLTAGGDTVKLAEAKKMFVPVLIGIFWIFGAYLVVYTLLDKLVADTIGGTPKEDIIFLDVKK